jgi:5-methyltetrahydropteroyltriglutamate--homocysteine methyltransferase
VCNLPRHLRPGFQPVRPFELRALRLQLGRHAVECIDEATKFVGIDQLALSPQCGFASGLSGNDLSHDQQWRKLEVILETARRVWH